ncbi:MAG TPA: adenylosuccinate lyase family protein [Streptosporangiaceae bacterium]|nr:adenylosuccinate lyase family protein [Streptosporangiaceae bacterium]
MGTRIADSALYAHLWGTGELGEVFEERSRIQSWLEILTALAEVQAGLGIIPGQAARDLAAVAVHENLDLDFAARETRRTGHSTLGFIEALQRALPPGAGEWAYYGATVQDLTDTWMALAMKRVGAIAWRDLRVIEDQLLTIAASHRDTVMAGRTHGQPGSLMTFGLKAASWADEVRRHLERLRQGAPRWLVGQLAGAVGSLGFFGAQGLELRRTFCERLGLGQPDVSWTSCRDRPAEFCLLLAMITATLARIGSEVYQLQRLEIGELSEGLPPGAVSSITMPHKRNPEAAEHLVTLSRLAKANAQVLLEGMVAEHERDGRSWKAEWPAFPETCLLAGTALALAKDLLADLRVHPDAMLASIDRARGFLSSEQVLAALAPRLGKHRAQALLQETLGPGWRSGQSLTEVVQGLPVEADLKAELLRAAAAKGTGSASAMVDEVVARARTARAAEGDQWP